MFRVFSLLRQRKSGLGPLIVVGIFIFFWTISIGTLEFYYPMVFEDIMANLFEVGILLSIPGLVALLIDLPVGDLCEKFGSKRMILLGIILTIIVGAAFRFVSMPVEAIVILILYGICYQFIVVPTITHIMHISPKKKTGEYFGFYDSFFALGYAVGPLIGGFLLTGVPDNIFDFMIIMSLISFSVAYLGISEKRKHTKFLRGLGSMIRKDKIFIADLKEYKKLGKAGVIIIYFSMLFAVWEGFIWGFVPLFSERVFTTMIYGGMMLTAFALPYVLFQLPSGFLADRYGKRRFMSLGFFVAGLFSILISMTTEPMLLISFAFLAASGMAIASPSVMGFLTDISVKEKRGEISGVRAFAEDIGFVIGPMAGGALIYSFGFGNTFVIFGILLFISAVLSLLAKRKR